jgi:CheY-like chemotaxis protein
VKSAKKGFGIGLALSQRLLGTMGSRIVAKSQPSKGSEFSFSVECDMVQLQEAFENGSRGGLIAYTFLLVDDDPQMLRMLQNVLWNYGVRLLTAKSGEDAERHWAAGVDLVITDQFMDGGNGWNVLEKCASYRIPAILLSATEPKRPDGLSNDKQFNAFLQKPFNTGELLYEIGRALGTQLQLPEAEHLHLDQGIHSKSLMHRPSAVSLEMLRRYVREGAYSEIERWVAEGETQHPECGPFFAAVSGANTRLDFPELRRLAGNDQEQAER